MADCKICVHKMACAVYADNRNKVILNNAACDGFRPTIKKPIVRHCRNCRWCDKFVPVSNGNVVFCSVKYKPVRWQRVTALLCRYFCKVEEADEGK